MTKMFYLLHTARLTGKKAMSTTYIFFPPLKKLSGGMGVLLQVAGHLEALGRPVALVVRDEGVLERLDVPLPETVVSWGGLRPSSKDLWVVPEGWPNVLAPGLESGARCVIYCQNWAFLFSGLPDGVGWRQLPVNFLAVSHPVALFLEQSLGRRCPVLPPAIDASLFFPPPVKPEGLRVGYMPRKNKGLINQVRRVIEARNVIAPEWVAIEGVTRREVARLLATCHVFLASGFPEGFGLPPLEAMACGCVPVGFAGFGGWDYMRPADTDGYRPWWELPPVPWQGNGFWVADGDVLAAALALEQAAGLWSQGDGQLLEILGNGRRTVEAYSMERQREAVEKIFVTGKE